ncbi:hypothetical protein CBR_g51226 [Chara braunii]|uniref:Reverse transcriptase/retrotransposon-derived protein RNase H-like domain-containing protein n=1 Tax=Chara braunii TaxID=69332 RepID=A0A388M804_CHABU|nr:hypothetical protein CBR_g51226 [Chara braunii]|eukprot:GBG90717.1 hypothetical protein CBR_g51226 [Chara braunii]
MPSRHVSWRLNSSASMTRQQHGLPMKKGTSVARRKFIGERALLTMAAEWRTEADNSQLEDSANKIALLLSHLTDLLATCITLQAEILGLDNSVAHLQDRLQRLEQRPVAAADVGSFNTADRPTALEMHVSSLQDGAQLQQTATQQLQQRICTTATTSSPEPRESTPKFDGQEIFCDEVKTDPIPWFRKFELTLQLSNVKEHKHHSYLYSRSGGACQAWLDNLLSKYGVVAADLHTKITWDDLKAAWHKRFQVEPPEIKAMDKLMVFEQGSLPSADWIAEFQRLTSVPNISMGFKAIRHYFISRSCPALSNALTHVEDTLTTTAELFDKAAQIIITNKEAKNLRSSASGPSGNQHRPQWPWSQRQRHADLPTEGQGSTGKLSIAESDATTLSTPSELVSSRVTNLHSEAHAEVDSPSLLLSFEDYAARLVPTLGTQAQGQGVCAVSSPSGNNNNSSSSGDSWDSTREFKIEALDPLTSEDFAWLPLPTTGCLPGPQCAALTAHLHTYLSFYAPPTSPTDDEVAVGDILAYTTKVAREFRTQRYDNNNAPLMYVRIQVGQASCNALLDSGATRNFMSQSFMQRAGLGAQVRRKANPTAIKLADGKTQQLLDRYIEAVPVYFAPHACEPVTFDILDTDFDIILGMPWLASADHTVNFHRRTPSVRDTFGGKWRYKANRDKCEFVQQELEYLGHFVTPEGISPLSDKIQAVLEWPEPRNVTDVRSFLGLTGYYQRFIKGYSKIVAHLNKLQCEDRPFDFGEEARGSFLALKAALLSAEVLRIYDPLASMRVTTDASGYGIGAVLEQHDGVDWHPVEYFSKKVPLVHSIDDARKKELLAFVHALKRWRHFLLGRSQFRWVTDNNLLVFYKTQDTVNSTIARWMAFIDQFDFFPDHIPGKSNRFADAFSRRPDHCTAVYSTFEIDDDLRNSFIRGYQADPDFRNKYTNCSSPHLAPSHYRIQEGYLLVHTRGKDLLCVPSDPHLRNRLLGEFHDAPATGHFGVNRTIG